MPAPPKLATMFPGVAHVSPKKKGKKKRNYGVFQLCLEVGVGALVVMSRSELPCVYCHVCQGKALDHCNPKHQLAVVVSSLVAHQIPAAVVVFCLFVWVFQQID